MLSVVITIVVLVDKVILPFCTHPAESVTVTTYVPETRLSAVAPVPPYGDHEYVYGGSPPIAVAVAMLELSPEHEIWSGVTDTIRFEGFGMLTVSTVEQLFESV